LAANTDRGTRFAPIVHSVQDNVIGVTDPRTKHLPRSLCKSPNARKEVNFVIDSDLDGIRLEFSVVAEVEDQAASGALGGS